MAQRSQALAFGELLAGGVLAAAAVSGHSVRDILAGVSSPLAALVTPFPTGAAGSTPVSSTGPAAGHMFSPKGAHGAVNPVPGWTLGRVDQGVDFGAPHPGAPILAPLAAKVLGTGAPGWPGGGGVLLRLSNGQNMYINEDLVPVVHTGQEVQAGQVIAHGTGGPDGIEIGWADSSGVPLSHAGYTEGKVTTYGQKMLAFLHELGIH